MTSVVEGSLIEMRTIKVVAVHDDVEGSAFNVVLGEVGGGRKLAIGIGPAEALDLSAGLDGHDRARPTEGSSGTRLAPARSTSTWPCSPGAKRSTRRRRLAPRVPTLRQTASGLPGATRGSVSTGRTGGLPGQGAPATGPALAAQPLTSPQAEPPLPPPGPNHPRPGVASEPHTSEKGLFSASR